MPSPTASRLQALQSQIWTGSLPLEIRLAASDCRTFDSSEPYLIQYPRLSYLAFLLPKLHTFFAPSLINPEIAANEAWLEFEGVPLKWQLPVGLLADLYSRAEPMHGERQAGDGHGGIPKGAWRLTVHYTEFPGEQLIQLDAEGRVMLDTFINAVKEADYIRNGTARTVMSLSKEDSDKLWLAVQNHDRNMFNSVNNKLLNPPGLELRHVPIRIYLPTSASQTTTAADTIPEEAGEGGGAVAAAAGHLRVVQSLVPIQQPTTKQLQTLGTALNSILPTIFPSRRNPLLAQPVLHGAAVPMSANLDELGRAAAYTDGFLHIAVVMLG